MRALPRLRRSGRETGRILAEGFFDWQASRDALVFECCRQIRCNRTDGVEGISNAAKSGPGGDPKLAGYPK
jgi:hypothetical protein